MNTQKYNELKSAIVSAVPEIMELGFGCEVILVNKNFPKVINLKTPIVYCKQNGEFQLRGRDDFYTKFDCREIIGRNITIADVLLAIYKNRDDNEYAVDLSGNFMKLDSGDPDDEFDTFEHTKYWWNNHKDLSGQDEETINFLHSILCGEEK